MHNWDKINKKPKNANLFFMKYSKVMVLNGT